MVAVCTGTKVRHMHSPGIWIGLSRDHLQGPRTHIGQFVGRCRHSRKRLVTSVALLRVLCPAVLPASRTGE